MPPGTSEAWHYHRRSQQFFYTLSGELTMEVDGRLHVLGPGDGIAIAPGHAHQAMNRTRADVRMLVISQPASHADRLPA